MKKLKLKVSVNKPKTKITNELEDVICLDVAAPAENNKANIEIIKFFTKEYHVSVSQIKLKGLKSKNKILIIENLD